MESWSSNYRIPRHFFTWFGHIFFKDKQMCRNRLATVAECLKSYWQIVSFSFKCYICPWFCLVMRALYLILKLYFTYELVAFCCVACAANSSFYGFICWFPYFTNVVQLLCSLSGRLHLNCSSFGTGFNGAETNCRIAYNLGILLMNSNCFGVYF